jgi:hypothetical protein
VIQAYRETCATVIRRFGGHLAKYIFLASLPRAGEGVNLYLFRLARALHPYRSADEIAEMLQAVTAGCGRIVTAKEIRRAIENSTGAAWKPSQGNPTRIDLPWPNVNVEQREAVIAAINMGLADLWEISPFRFGENDSQTEAIIDELFPGDALLCCGKSSAIFATQCREEWRGQLSEQQLIVPSPMSSRTGRTQNGNTSEHTLENTGARCFLIVEQDGVTVRQTSASRYWRLLTLQAASGPKLREPPWWNFALTATLLMRIPGSNFWRQSVKFSKNEARTAFRRKICSAS